tara:strand:+ start:109 stop:423 length:315 start_codon:yes stop_codon:yes gene_type:complete
MKRDLKNPLSKTTEPSFRTAFSSAKKSGKKTFNWKSKNYTTQTAEEKAKKMSYKDLKKAESKAQEKKWDAFGVESKPKGRDLQKSTTEIHNSYKKVKDKRYPAE